VPLRYVSYQHYTRQATASYPAGTVLFFDPRIELSFESVTDRLRGLDDEVRGADLIILRGSSRNFNADIAATPLLKSVVGDVPTVTLAPRWDELDSEPVLEKISWATEFAGTPPRIDTLRELEIQALLHEGKAIFEQPGCHYELPAHVHASAFIRLADCLCDATDVIRVVDWLLPSLQKGCGIITDTGSLLGLLATASLEATDRFGWARIPAVALDRYPDLDHLTEVARAFRVNECSAILFVMSVNSSGGLARLVSGMESIADLVIVCQSGEPVDGATIICQHSVDRWKVDSENRCEACDRDQLLVIDPESYEVRTDLDWDPQRLDTEIAEKQSKFWEAVDRTDAVMLHVERDIPTEEGEQIRTSRHMAVYLDIKLLLADEWFRAQVAERLRSAGPADLVVIPQHAATEELASLAGEALPELDPGAVLKFSGTSFSAVQAEKVEAAGRVLIVDDALITGSTLYRVQAAIYEISQRVEQEIDFAAFVVVSRPPSPDDEVAVKRRYGFKTDKNDGSREFHFSAAFKVALPARSECAFCAEKEILKKRKRRVRSDALDARIDRLANSTAGLQEPILLGETAASGKTVGSFFGKLKPRTAFAAATSVAQRQKWSFARERRANTVKVLDSTLVVEGYYDPALAAGVLRNFDQRDLRSPGLDQQFNRALERRGEVMHAGAISEIAWSAVMRKLPPEGIRLVIERRPEADPGGLLGELLTLD
jgi:hypothetical protein